MPRLALSALFVFAAVPGRAPSSVPSTHPSSGLRVAPPVEAPPDSELRARISAILAKAGLRKILLSACVVRSGTGEPVYENNPHLALMPASNMKIVTTAAALETLGADFSFITRAGLCGETLVVKGCGDPLLGDKETDQKNGRPFEAFIGEIASGLKRDGVASISDIILDDSIFDDQRVHPSWPRDQLHQKYACEVCGINYNGNCVDISAANRQGKAVLSIDPPTDYVKLRNEVTVWKSPKSWFSVRRVGERGELLIEGNCRARAGPYSVAVENPALYFGRLLRAGLLESGIRVAGEVLERSAPEGVEFREVARSVTPVGNVLQRTNKDSLNLAAEALCKRLGAKAGPGGGPGSWTSGGIVLAEFLKTLGVEESEFVIADGSGLSRDDRLSAFALTRVLEHLANGPNWEVFKDSLAVGGLDGTLQRHFYERKYRGRILAKTGYIQAVRALSGIAHTDSGDFIFSFLANNAGYNSRAAIEDAVKAIVTWGAKPSSH